MKYYIKFIAVFLVVFLNYSCRTYRNIENIEPISDQAEEGISVVEFEKLSPGDEVKATLKNGRTVFLYFSNFTGCSMEGRVFKDSNIKEDFQPFVESFPATDIFALRVEKINWLLTVSLPILALTGISILLLEAFVIAHL